MNSRITHRLRTMFGLSLVLIFLLTPAATLAQGSQPQRGEGYYYDVRPGDSWIALSRTLGVPVTTLKAHNPQAIHRRDFLWVGDRLWIPVPKPSPQPESGYWYTVKRGQTWNTVSRATGESVAVLKQANPVAAADSNGWLYIGQVLWIPTAAFPAAAPTIMGTVPSETAIVASTPTATLLATRLAVAAEVQPATLTSEVPETEITETVAIEPTVVSVATLVTAPAPTASFTPPPASPVPATSTPTSTPTATSTSTPAPTATLTPTLAPTATMPPTPTSPVRATPTPTPVPAAGLMSGKAPACPSDPVALPGAIATYLNAPGNELADLRSWLTGCNLIDAETGDVTEFSTPGTTAKEIVVVLLTQPADQEEGHGLLLVYHKTGDTYSSSHQVEGAGKLKLLKSEDINADGEPELVYTDTSCGAHTCFSTLFVERWNGSTFQNWIKGEPTMAGGEYAFDNTVSAGQGEAIVVHGGLINSAGAGPQRAWRETYISPEGGPYELYKKVYDKSSCLYHQILDANEQFDKWGTAGFVPATTAYETAIADKSATACGPIPDELNTLADFARFRLILAWISRGRTDKANSLKAQIAYKPLVGATDAFLKSLNTSHSIVQACRDTTKYAEANPDSWKYLADWGYANPSFTAKDLCPLG